MWPNKSQFKTDSQSPNERMGNALGYARVAENDKGATIAPYEGTKAMDAQSRGTERWQAAGRGPGRHSDVGQPHVRVVEGKN